MTNLQQLPRIPGLRGAPPAVEVELIQHLDEPSEPDLVAGFWNSCDHRSEPTHFGSLQV